MNTHDINGVAYYLFTDLKASKHPSTQKCSQSHQKYILHNRLKINDDYIYARLVNNTWIVSNGKSKSLDKLFISATWINSENLIPDIIPITPCIDHKGNAWSIEIRGERTPEGCFFSAEDLEKIYAYNTSRYVKDRDYVIFATKIFLTLDGLLLSLSKAKRRVSAMIFKWLSQIFFEGTIEIPRSANKTYEATKTSLQCLSGPVPAIYLIRLGTVQACKEAFNIPDSHAMGDGVYKVGKAGDVLERLQQHSRGYRRTILVEACYVVDYIALSEAELAALDYFGNQGMRLDSATDKEIVIFPDKKLTPVKKALKTRMARFVPAKENSAWIIDNLRQELAMTKKDCRRKTSKLKNELNLVKLQHQTDMEKMTLTMEAMQMKYEYELANKRLINHLPEA